jgi:hypothetical protein
MSLHRFACAALLASALSGCAVAGYTPDAAPQMPAVRQAMAPHHRFFYDALVDYGDWVLIEPYGYMFRPDVNFVAWRPYVEGFWAPTDVYGWVWVSSEPFGWATYHYGQWAYDRFQGWVWQPGLEWAPAWVDWRASDRYVGWAPRMPLGIDDGSIPGGAYVFVPTMQIASTAMASGFLSAEQVASDAAAIEPVRNFAERDGVVFNLGPDMARIERVTGLLQRGSLADLIPADQRASTGVLPDRPRGAAAPAEDLIRLTRRVGIEAARDAESVAEAGAPTPLRIPVVRPVGRGIEAGVAAPAMKKPSAKPARKAAAPDSSRAR